MYIFMLSCIYAEMEKVSQEQFSLLNQPWETYYEANTMLGSDILRPQGVYNSFGWQDTCIGGCN